MKLAGHVACGVAGIAAVVSVASADVPDAPPASAAPAAAPPSAPGATPSPAPVPPPEPGWFKLPAGATELRISGYAKLDAIYDLRAPQGYINDVPEIPLAGTAEATRRGNASLHARESRLVIESRTHAGGAELKSLLDADFFTADGAETQVNSTRLRLRRYYGTYGRWLAGQNWSTFMDLDAIPDTEDYEGPSGQIFIRQAQLRWTLPLGARSQLAVAIENPAGDLQPVAGVANASPRNRWPDATSRFTTAGAWGHLSLSGLVRELRSDDGAGHVGAAWGYALGIAGSFAIGPDRVLYELNGGRGIGRYVLDLGGYGARWNGEDRVTPIPAWGGFAAYQHQWARALRSTIVYSETRVYGEAATDAALSVMTVPPANRRTQSLHANLFWDVADQLEVGIEYSRGRRETVNGNSGVSERIQLGIRFYLAPRH